MYDLPGHLLRQMFVTGEISATEICQFFLKRISRYEPQICSLLSILADRAIDKAKKLDLKRSQGLPLGKLAGIPIVLKDNIQIQGEKTTCGSKMLSKYIAPFDATVTRLIDQEDGLIIGKGNLDEFAMGSSTEYSAFQLTRNPWDLSRSPGGSSGGSAAAVAARLCPISLGSDTGGSVRQPASFCGIIGFKPSYGRISRHGLVAFVSSLDQIGPFTTNLIDTAIMMEVLAHPCQRDSNSISGPPIPYLQLLQKENRSMVIGIPKGFLSSLKSEVLENFTESIDQLKKMGHRIVEIELEILQNSVAVYQIISTAEASTNLARFDGVRFGNRSSKAKKIDEVFDLSREEGFNQEVKRRIMLGTYVLSEGYQKAYYEQAQKIRSMFIQKFKQAFTTCDILATPTSPNTAFELGTIQDPLSMSLQDIYTIPANLAGLPAISVASGFCKQKQLPLGIHFMGPQFEDGTVLQIAHQFNLENNFAQKIPPLFDEEGFKP